MEYLLLSLPIVLPVVFWAAYHLHVDRDLPEPLGQLLLAFALGIGSFFIGAMLYRALGAVGLRRDAFILAANDLPGLFTYAVLAIGVIEESAKLIPFLLIVLRFREFNEPIDGIVYASFIALGFAAMENLLYLPGLATRAAYARGFAGPVVHMVFASLWGYYVGRAWLRRRALAATVVVSLGLTACLHGVYDFVVIGMPEPGLPLAATIITGLWIWRLCVIRDLHENFQRQRQAG
jgi:RsiW-degrading membrane proteinase PrsW (M82 family)